MLARGITFRDFIPYLDLAISIHTLTFRIAFMNAVKLAFLAGLFVPCFARVNAQVDSCVVIGIHPKAAAQSTATGKTLVTLFPWKGKLYAGYGDYGANTGPITIMSFDPVSYVFSEEWIANTEAIQQFRSVRGKVYAPATDRKLYSQPGDYSLLDTNGVWSNRDCGSTTHAYDVAALGDSDLVIVGSQDRFAAVFRSTDDGATWRVVRRDSAVSGQANDFARYYFAAVLDGKLYIQARDYYGSLHPASRVFDGKQWADGPHLFAGNNTLLGWRPLLFNNKLVYRSWAAGWSSQLLSFDGTTSTFIGAMKAYDHATEGGRCYVLADSGDGVTLVQYSEDLSNWTRLARVPSHCRSIAVLQDSIYLGTTDSEILKLVPPSTTGGVAVAPSSSCIDVFPNPTRGHITLSVHEADVQTVVTVTDALGRMIERRIVTNGQQSTRFLLPDRGWFVVTVVAGDKQFRKVVFRR